MGIVNRNWRFLRHSGPKTDLKKIRYTFGKHKMNGRVAKDVNETFFFRFNLSQFLLLVNRFIWIPFKTFF